MKTGLRKFIITILSLFCFTLVMTIAKTEIDPFNLGMGLCFLLAPGMAANAFEHKYKGVNNE